MARKRPVAAADAARLLTEIIAASPPAHDAADPLPPRATAGGTLRRLQAEALRQFAARGYHAVSVRDLAAGVGIHPSSIYAHVPSKAGLLADLLRLGHVEHRDRLRQALLDCGSDPGEQVTALTRAHVRMHAEYPLLARVANRELGTLEGAALDEITAVRLDSERLFLDVVNRGRQLGAFGAEVDPLIAVAAIGAMGIRVAEWWNPTLGITVDDLADQYATLARNMLR
ncbi:DNA-binding transcriptional regulator, AcrR family [Micromonospora pallida]|uniref:DNA-binding transcriptional regulator, AcrR family n=1 Tax=Micromonospora pallida TaxID=145854 RepID=A0A1C6SH47_9ACTN|nr:TetR/AcrR family transcriptional regulator [Micromonospora pallida]SCL28752.1 DNA-binding transcriptional regulator, AcrR family [Micromonospora pallida]